MIDRITQFITSKYLRFADDEIRFGKDRVVIYSLEQIVDQSHLNQKLFGLRYQLSVYESAMKVGNEFIRNHAMPMKKLLNPVIKISSEVISSFGFVIVRAIKVDDSENSMFIAGSSSIAELYKKKYGNSNMPVDLLLSGVFAGALQYFSQRPVYCVELSCSAQKDVEECVWFSGSREEILKYTNRFFSKNVERVTNMLDSLEKTSGMSD